MTDMASSGPISEVREGMAVLDASGDEVGTVAEVRLGDPGATTSAGQGTGRDDTFVGAIAETFAGSTHLSEQAQERLARLGYLRIDAKGLFAGDRYAAADEVAHVAGDTVHLSLPADRLLG